jgi:hypothetical protein
MMSNSRSWSSCALILALALVACSSSSDAIQAPADADDALSRGSGPHRDAQTSPRDAYGAPDARPGDAAVASDAGGAPIGDGGGGLAGAGVVSCYSEYAPSTTCALPSHCCFTNYSAEHAGSCDTAVCTWGTIDCDGPEDCANGQRCCAHVIIDPDNGITGYKLACQADACGAAPANVELCHDSATAAGTCDGGRACVSAATQDYDLPRALSICR